MSNHDLYRAIGEADETFLLECEQSLPRRSPGHLGIIAALIALMLTACAAPVIIRAFDKVQSGNRSKNGYDHVIYEYKTSSKTPSAVYYLSSDAEIEVSVNKDAPNEIVTQYLPLQLFDNCQLEEYEQTDESLILTLSTNIPKFGKIPEVQYRQYALPKDGIITVPGILDPVEWENSEKVYGNATTLEFRARSYSKRPEHASFTVQPALSFRVLFWSDGDYLFCLKFPITNKLTTSVIPDIVNSLTPVEYISQYLTTQ